jgi:hypothetical protein
MTLKKYLRPGEAAFYLERLLGYPVSKKDIFDLHSEGKLLFVARFTGVRIVQDDGVGQKAKGDRYHDGYFVVGASRKLKGISVSRSSTHYQLYEWVKYYGDNPPAPMTSLKIDDPIRSAVSKAFGYLEYGEAFEEIYNPNISYKQEDVLIPRAELDALIARHQADSTPAPAPVAASEPAPQVAEAPPEALSAKASALPAALAAVLDPTHRDHAPDLAEAIRLWLALYGGERTQHSHSAACNHWLKAQGISGTAANRIKEISSPQHAWDAQRKERHASRKKRD